jgi:choice-of-anchor B domain-containing protein
MEKFRIIFLFSFLIPTKCVLCQGCEMYILQLNTGDWAEEYSWSITDNQGVLIDTSSISYLNYLEYLDTVCIVEGCYFLNLYDSYGDGWQGGTYSFLSDSGTLIASGHMEGSYFNSSQGFCVPEEIADSCSANSLMLTISTGGSAEEVCWSIYDSLGTVLDTSDFYEPYQYFNYTTYQHDICLADGCFYFNMYDSYGDGWQGGFVIIEDNQSNIVSVGDLPTGFYGELSFSLNSDCDLDICTDESANNYNEVSSSGCIYISHNTSLYGQWSDENLPINSLDGSYSDVYGYEKEGREYAIIGSTNGTHIIDINEPGNLIEIAFIQGSWSGSGVIHRDYHIIEDLLYAVCDQGESTLQIIDLSNLPESTDVVYDSNELFSRSHNIFIDTISQKLYSCSTEGYDDLGNFWNSSLCVYDISSPLQPSLLHNMNEYMPNTHDIWVDNDTAFINCPGNGTLVWEFTSQPTQISSFTSYPDFGTNHSGWKSGDIYVFAEENNGYDLKIVDASNISDLELISIFNSNVNEFSIAHNLMIKDNLVYISYYQDGLQVFDISNPNNPIRIAYYDTYIPENTGGYAGAWGVYAFLPSGRILISDVQSGLFVVNMEYVESQEIAINSGWNLISTYLKNDTLNPTNFIGDNANNIIIMKNNLGQAFIPSLNFDGIGYLEYGEAYQIKANDSFFLDIYGHYLSSFSIVLDEGWNMIAVLNKAEQPIEEVLINCEQDVIIVKNYLGDAYLPEWQFNAIGNMIPGQGYQTKMNAVSEIIFNVE